MRKEVNKAVAIGLVGFGGLTLLYQLTPKPQAMTLQEIDNAIAGCNAQDLKPEKVYTTTLGNYILTEIVCVTYIAKPKDQ
jgi:hypothetical protein